MRQVVFYGVQVLHVTSIERCNLGALKLCEVKTIGLIEVGALFTAFSCNVAREASLVLRPVGVARLNVLYSLISNIVLDHLVVDGHLAVSRWLVCLMHKKRLLTVLLLNWIALHKYFLRLPLIVSDEAFRALNDMVCVGSFDFVGSFSGWRYRIGP